MTRLLAGIITLALNSSVGIAAPLSEVPGTTVGYTSVAQAFAALSAQPGIQRVMQNGWTILDDEAGHIIWSFAPQGSPPFPAVVKREIVSDATGISIKMDVLCESKKSACDDMVVMFEKLNETIKQQMSQRR